MRAIILFLKRCWVHAHVMAAPCGDQGNRLMRCQSEPQSLATALQQETKLGRRTDVRCHVSGSRTDQHAAASRVGWSRRRRRGLGRPGIGDCGGWCAWRRVEGEVRNAFCEVRVGESGRRAGGLWSKSEIDDRTEWARNTLHTPSQRSSEHAVHGRRSLGQHDLWLQAPTTGVELQHVERAADTACLARDLWYVWSSVH